MKQYTEEIIQILKQSKLRFTKTRLSLLQIFFQNEEPMAVSTLLSVLSDMERKVNKTTVYRELEQLESKGIIRAVHLGNRRTSYELALREHHHHLICLLCECVEDIDMNEEMIAREERIVKEKKGFMITKHALEFYGYCRMCQRG